MNVQDKNRQKAKEIGNDSWELLNYASLSRGASRREQIEALRADRRWLDHKFNETMSAIDELIDVIMSQKGGGE